MRDSVSGFNATDEELRQQHIEMFGIDPEVSVSLRAHVIRSIGLSQCPIPGVGVQPHADIAFDVDAASNLTLWWCRILWWQVAGEVKEQRFRRDSAVNARGQGSDRDGRGGMRGGTGKGGRGGKGGERGRGGSRGGRKSKR